MLKVFTVRLQNSKWKWKKKFNQMTHNTSLLLADKEFIYSALSQWLCRIYIQRIRFSIMMNSCCFFF